MALHVIIGAGPVGSAAADHLSGAGHRVRVVTRSGTGADRPGVERVRADAADADRLTELTRGAAALYNCANPAYHRWTRDWPPLNAAMLAAAERTGAVLVTMGNLYGYGPVDGPMTPDLPLRPSTVKGRVRAQMWRDALAAHEAGLIRAVEVRGSDFIGPGGKSIFNEMVLPRIRAGKVAYAPVSFDVPHSLTYTVDAGRALAVAGTDERAWGRPWHVPTAPALTLRAAAERFANLVGAPAPRLRTMSTPVLRLGGLFDPGARGFIEMRYQFTRPFVLDSSETERTFGLTPTDFDDALRSMA